jgi:type VI secretion system protein ImpF
MLDRVGLHASIRFELDRLLNTRTPVSADDLDRRPRGTLDYGLPDLSLFWPFDTTSEAQLAGLITRTVAAFEPRLLNPHARIERVGNERRRLRVEIGGSVALNGMVEPVTFPILLSDSAGDNVEG